jgi:hypothetical protein
MSISPRNRRRLIRLLLCLGAAAAMMADKGAADAQDFNSFHEIETKYIFGNFTVGSSTGIQGEVAFEPDTEFDFGKRSGRYMAGQTELELEYTPTQFLQIEMGPTVSYYNIQGVPGLDNRNMGSINGFEADFRSLLIDRSPSMPFAVTASIEPEWHSLDETSGAAVSNYGLETRIEADAELIKNRLFLGFNLLYEPESTYMVPAGSNSESTVGVSSALALQIIPNVVVGGDLWYLRHYDGSFDSFTGDAVYLGPTFYWKIAPKVLMSAAWEAQIAGREVGVSPALDLTDFSRQRARLLLEFEF